MRPGSRALLAIVRDLIDTRDGATYFAERVWGVSLRYDLDKEHPLVGRSCPDFELEGGTRVGTLLVSPDGFVAWASDATPSPEAVTRAAARWFTNREPRSTS